MTALTRIRGIAWQAWLPVLLLALWYVASRDSQSLYFPPLQKIWDALLLQASSGQLWRDLAASMRNIGAGLVLGVLVGVTAGVFIGRFRPLREAVDPYLQFARSVPQVALIPIVIGALGITAAPKIWAIAFACVWPVLLNTVDGVRSIDPGVRDLTRAYRITPARELFRVVLPAAMPQIIAGIRVALGVAVVVMVVSEIYGATEGLGYFINPSGSSFKVAAPWAGTLLVGFIGYVLSTLFLVVEHHALRWYHESAA